MRKKFFEIGKSKKKIIIIDENNNKISEYQLYKKVEASSKYFKDYSVVAIIADNSLDFITCYVAAMNKSNVITLLLDETFSKNYIQNLIKLYKPHYVFCPKNIELEKTEIIKRNSLKNFKILKIRGEN